MMFLSPAWFALLGVVALYVWGVKRQGWKMQGWLLVSIVMVIVALGRPALPQKPLKIEEGGSDVILAVDLSYSMRATDISPSRLEAAKALLKTAVRSNPKERFGVIAFTTSAIVLSPLTKDRELLEHLFDGLDESQIITKGTRVMSALELARKMSHAHRPTVVLLTDGGDEASYEKEAAFVRDNNLALHVVMLATAEGSTIPTDSGASFKDEGGHIVITSRNDAIAVLAEAGGGRVIRGSDAGALDDAIEEARSDDFKGSSTVIRYTELFYIPLLIALFAFVAAFTTVGEKISKRFLPLLALIGLSAQAGVLDFAYLYIAKANYEQGNFERSEQFYGKLSGDEARYNRANALYKAGKYSEALGVYRSIRSNDPVFKSRLYHNIGNCHIRLQEFENARTALLKSLTLRYTKAADDNLRAIAGSAEKQTLNVRKEKQDKFAKEENAPTGESKPSKQGGGSNMQSDMASGGGGDEGKKAEADSRLSMAQGKAKLSSRQYELINQRSVHETKPW